MNTDEISVVARRWARGWELIIDDDHATQVRVLSGAEQQVRDYLETIDPETDYSQIAIDVVIEVNSVIRADIEHARAATRAAAAATEHAAVLSREVVRSLRSSGLSADDTSTVLDISRSRVYQLLGESKSKKKV